ncbi:MAG: response regulator, partial [Chitinophagaceae bacterium]
MMILYIDDDIDDQEMLTSAIHDENPLISISVASDGREGLMVLERASRLNTLPKLVVLDINMPVLDGKKTLEIIRKHPSLSSLPVIIFSSSQNANDKDFFSNYASEFITKPMRPSELKLIARQMIS